MSFTLLLLLKHSADFEKICKFLSRWLCWRDDLTDNLRWNYTRNHSRNHARNHTRIVCAGQEWSPVKSSKPWPHNGQIMAAVCEINNQKMDNFPIAAISIEEAALKSLRQFVKRLDSFRGWVGGFLSGWFFTGLYLNGLYSRCTRLRWSLLGSAQMFFTRMVLREKKARWILQ